jgi:hypothetical protein
MSLQVPLNLTQTNGHYTFTVPAYGYQNVINIDMAGAGGGAGGRYYGSNGAGGNGSRINGSFNVSPGDVIDVYIGGAGGAGGAAPQNSNAGGAGGYGALIGDTYGSGTVYPVSLSWAWSGFMNTYAVWVNPDEVNPVGQLVTITRIVNVPVGQSYQFEVQADNHIDLYVDNGHVLTTESFQGSTYQNVYLNPGQHTITMNVENYGGPAGFAVTMTGNDDGVQYWNTRSNLSPNSYRYNFSGGRGGNTYGDGGYVYPAPGGGGGATVVFVNGNLVLVAGGGGGGGSEGGHGAGGTPGAWGGGGSLEGTKGQDGVDGYDIAGTPGGGGGFNGGAAGTSVYYDDAPSLGANGGTNYNGFIVTYTSGNGVYTVPNGVTQITVTVIGGGGGGGGCSGNEEPVYTGGGGAGGDTVSQIINVTPGQQIAWTVGTGGAGGGVGYAGYAGLPSVFGGLVAGGGYGGGFPYGANNGVYVGDEYSASGGAGGAPNGGAGGSYDEDAEVGYSGQNGGSGSISIQIGSWTYSIYASSGTLGDGLPGFCNLTFSRLGAGSVKVNGNWKFISENYVKVNNAWKVVAGSWVKVNGNWKLISSSGAPSVSFIPA